MRSYFLRTGILSGVAFAMSGLMISGPVMGQTIKRSTPEQQCEFLYAEIMLSRMGGPGGRVVSEEESRWADEQHARVERGEPCEFPADVKRIRDLYEDADRLSKLGDAAGARAILQALCFEDADDVACQNYGVMAMTGEGGGVDMAEGRRAFLIACDQGLLKACQNYADALLNGEGGPVDDPGALEIYVELCQKKYGGRNCFRAARMIEDGRGVTQPDRAKAYEGYMAACRQLYTEGCLRATDMKKEGI